MICRRCGLDSSTTDICEWCKKPMLPEGGTISAKAKQEIQQQRAQAAAEAAAPPEPPRASPDDEMTPARPGLAPPPLPPEVHESGLLSLGAHLTANVEPTESAPSLYAVPVEADSDPLRPLGASTTNQDDGSADLSAETARYVGNDEESILRPIERPQGQGSSQWIIDPATGKRKRVVHEAEEIPDNTRILRATPHGAIAAFVVALLQFFIFHKVPGSIVGAMWAAPGLVASSAPALGNALAYGFYCAVLLGFPVAAVLVNRKWGAPAGFFLGIAIGFLVLGQGQDSPVPLISVFQGALAGILVGRITGKGVKRIISV